LGDEDGKGVDGVVAIKKAAKDIPQNRRSPKTGSGDKQDELSWLIWKGEKDSRKRI
jgi:hypothetical protein